jgi:hypothetical protein
MTIQPRRRPAEVDAAGAGLRWSTSVATYLRARFVQGRTPRGFGDVA